MIKIHCPAECVKRSNKSLRMTYLPAQQLRSNKHYLTRIIMFWHCDVVAAARAHVFAAVVAAIGNVGLTAAVADLAVTFVGAAHRAVATF